MRYGSIVVLILGTGIAAAAVFFALANRATRRMHAAFGPREVAAALECVLDDSLCHDEWDLFLSWPIADPYLESIRTQCLEIIRTAPPPNRGEDISGDGKNRIRVLLQGVRERF
jgi:hypothetical protein